MRRIKSAGAIVFRKEEVTIKYLLICYGTKKKFWWDFPRGEIKKGESEEEAAKREIFEETGIKDLEFIPGFRESYKYFFRGYKPENKRELIFKENVIYLAKTRAKKIKLSFEHHNFTWLQFKKAIKKLTFKNSKEILKKANKFLKSRIRNLLLCLGLFSLFYPPLVLPVPILLINLF